MPVRIKARAQRGAASKAKVKATTKAKSKAQAKSKPTSRAKSKAKAKPKAKPKRRSFVPPAAPPAPLPSANVGVEERIAVGARFPLDGLRTATYDLLDEWLRDRAELAPFSFHDGWAAGVHGLVGRIDSLAQGRNAVELGSKPTGLEIETLLGAGKSWRRRFAAVVEVSPLAERKPSMSDTRQSPLALADQLDTFATFAAEHAAELAPFGGGAAFAQEGRELAAHLRRARATHAAALNDLSPAARDLQAAKGTLYLELKRLSRAARAAVRPERRDRYILARLLRRSPSPKKSPAPPAV